MSDLSYTMYMMMGGKTTQIEPTVKLDEVLDFQGNPVYNFNEEMTYQFKFTTVYSAQDIIDAVWKSYSKYFNYDILFNEGRYGYAWMHYCY